MISDLLGSALLAYAAHVAIMCGIYIILAASLNLLLGYTGVLSVAHGAFYGVGAYVAALLMLRAHWPFLAALVASAAAGALAGAAVAGPAARLRGDYLAIATLSFQVLLFDLANNLTEYTGGPMGLPGVPTPEVGGWIAASKLDYVLLIASVCGLCLWCAARVASSPFGRVLRAIREDEVLASVAGKDVAGAKLRVFALSSAMASLAGAMYASYVSFVDPTGFGVNESILMVSMVVLGGAGRLFGPVLGACVLVVLPEVLRFFGVGGAAAANVRQMLYGAALVAFMLWRPQGLVGDHVLGGRQP